jgi:hypothetical protein
MSDLLPPQAAPQPGPGPTGPAPNGPTPTRPTDGSSDGTPRPSARVVSLLTVALGAGVAIVVAGGAVFSGIASAVVRTESRTIDARGIAELDVDISAGSLEVVFGDVDEATLEVTSGGGAERWVLERDGDELVVASPEWMLGAGWIFGGSGRATLTLPQALERTVLDAQLSLAAGDLEATGNFGDLDIEMGAGDATVLGTARDLSADVSAGRADLELAGVVEAELTLSAGQLDARLTGDAPDQVQIDVSAGSLDLTLPEGTYDVASNVSAGTVDNRLDTSPRAAHRVVVEVSAGQVVLRSAG